MPTHNILRPPKKAGIELSASCRVELRRGETKANQHMHSQRHTFPTRRQHTLMASISPHSPNDLPKSSESHVSDVSVPVIFVAKVEADSVDVLIVVSAFDVIDVPITIT